jgi:hypothetical protein
VDCLVQMSMGGLRLGSVLFFSSLICMRIGCLSYRDLDADRWSQVTGRD